MLAQTPLHSWHAAHGGRMVDFAGWSMPVQYTSIVAEHNATRTAVGLFDVSHMGRIHFSGPDAAKFLDRIVTRRATGMRSGLIRYALATNESGGILDDVLVYQLRGGQPDTGAGTDYCQLVVNASNREKILAWLAEQRGDENCSLRDMTTETAMIAVQGPRALEIVRPLVSLDPASLKYYHGGEALISGSHGIVSRTGYTGEDGCELIVPAAAAPDLWQQLVDAAERHGGMPAGLGCRDTLRLEAGMPLYGHELGESINPFQAGLGYAVDLENREFPGRAALAALRDDRTLPCRVGLELEGRRVPREGYPVHYAGLVVGHVTSGTFSPTLDKPIAMAYVRPDVVTPGMEVLIDIRGNQQPARIVQLPFYRRSA